MKQSTLLLTLTAILLMFSANIYALKESEIKESTKKHDSFINKKQHKFPVWNQEMEIKSFLSELSDLSKVRANPLTIEDFVEISFPYEQDHVYSDQYIVLEQYLLHGVPLKFTITENTQINFSAFSQQLGFVSFAFLFKDGVSITHLVDAVYDIQYYTVLTPGTYYLFVHDANFYEYYDEYLECLIRVNEFESVDYTDLDYLPTLSETNPSMVNIVNHTNPLIAIYFDFWDEYLYYRGFGFSAEVEAGKNYQFTCNAVTPETYIEQAYIVVFLRETLTGNIEYDIIHEGYGWDESVSNLTFNVLYVSSTTEIVKILFLPYECHSEITVNISMQEIDINPITIYDLLNEPMTSIIYSEDMDFTDSGTFDIETSYLVVGEDYLFRWDDDYFFAVPYKISLSQGDRIDIYFSHQMDAYLYLYRKDQNGDVVWVDENDDWADELDSFIRFTANIAGDYYIVGTTFDSMVSGNYSINVTSAGSDNSISIYDLLNEPMTTLIYSDDMDFTDSGYFDTETSYLVEGDGYLFKWEYEYFYAVPYKIYLPLGASINIYFSQEWDAYLYLYHKNYDGEIVCVDQNDDGEDGFDSFIQFKANIAGDYYIVGTTYSQMTSGYYSINVTSDGSYDSMSIYD
ncbi:MAG: pre-peptidase C-terminal domain-containing protein, partial [Marinilabiliaceae bacterium]|nr:pre-peptidase C-terminal domain-containing protein [Marinilabiliaceae bacterium]